MAMFDAIDGKLSLMSALQFEPLEAQDIAAIMPIERACHEFPSSEKLLRSCFSKRYHNVKMLLEGKVIGFYMTELVVDEMTLHNICIDPAYQGRGLGKQLFMHFLQTAEAKGAAQLWLEVRPSNTAAVQLYLTNGFHEAGRRKDYYPAKDGREDALLMGQSLMFDMSLS